MSTGIIKTLFYEKIRSGSTNRNAICLVLGAGADISSGGLTFYQLKKACVEHFSDVSLPSLLSPEKMEHYFNEFFEKIVSDKQRASVMDFLFHGMESLKPSDGYKLLVLLAKAGIIDSIITTNFDTMLETAQRELGLDIFQIYAPGVASPYVTGDQVFVPPRPIYIKLHGDIQAKRITHLTSREIAAKWYDRNFSLLLQSILQTQTLIFIGYSGSDEVFTHELSKSSANLIRPIYWCNIAPVNRSSTFGEILYQGEVVSINASFESVLSEAGAYPLRNITLLENKPHFLFPLLKDRINCANDQFINSYAFKDSSTRFSLLQSRQSNFDQIAAFRFNSESSLAVLTGLSGVGKTTLLCQLYDAEESSILPRLLLLQSRGITCSDFAEALSIKLGYAADNPFALLYELSAWLQKNGQQILIVIDSLNEFDWKSRQCLDLFKEILRVALWVQPHNSLKFLITMRPETWNEIYSVIDHSDLKKVLWNESEFSDNLKTLHLDKFSPAEMESAYESYAIHFGVTTSLRQLSAEAKKQLADPYFLALVMKPGGNVDPDHSFHLFEKVFNDILNRSFGISKAVSLNNSLVRLAAIGLNKLITEFPLEIIESVGIGHEELRILLEIPILQKTTGTTYCFTHDRVHEYYLAKAINELGLVQVRDWNELTKAVNFGQSYPVYAEALLQCILNANQLKREHYLSLIINGLNKIPVDNSEYPALVNENTIDFCMNIFFTIASEYPNFFAEIVDSCFDRGYIDSKKNILARLLMRASVLLPFNFAIPIFFRAKRELNSGMQYETVVFLYDKFVENLLEHSTNEYLDCFSVGPLNEYIFDSNIAEWQRIIRLLGLIARIGPDNVHPNEWKSFYACFSHQLNSITVSYTFPKSSEFDLANLVLQNSSTILFNAGPHVIEQYFMSNSRIELRDVFDRIEQGIPLSLEDINNLRKYVKKLDQNIEFVIMNLFFIISMKMDKARTLQLFSDYYNTFTNQTSTEELDFFLSALCLSHLALGMSCQAIVAHYTEQMMEKLPQISLGYPGATRGERRAIFTDPFEQQFEDGFNPFAFYFYNAPSNLRTSLSYTDYIKFSQEKQDPISLYWKCLEHYEQQNNQTGIIRIVHALGQMISLWPIEGLAAVEKLVGRTEPTVRRAIIRVLTEANARFPKETSLMLSRISGGFSEEERRQIYWSKESHVDYRALEQLHWSRIMFFLDQRDSSGLTFNKITRILVDSFSLPEAIGRIMNDVIINPSTV